MYNFSIINFVLQKIENEIKKEVDKATQNAKTCNEIGMEEISSDICVDYLEPKGNARNTTPWTPLKHIRIGPALNSKQTLYDCYIVM